MNLTHDPELIERLAASYALGTLRGGARRRFETLAREHASVRAAALVWQARWAGLTELQTAVPPSPAVWTRIDNLVQAERAAQAVPPRQAQATGERTSWWRNLLLWRGVAAAGALATVAAVVVGVQAQRSLQGRAGAQVAALQQQLEAAPLIQYVSVLSDDKAQPSMLVTFDPRNRQLVLQRVGAYSEGADHSLQLWALPPGGGPRSLGVLGRDQRWSLAVDEGAVQQVPTLAISLEPKGGVPSATGPTGPVLFQGALIERML
jgi:anti-sigma-K factor RskA